MTKNEFMEIAEQMGFEQAVIELEGYCEEVTSTCGLEEYAISQIKEGNYGEVEYVMHVLNNAYGDLFRVFNYEMLIIEITDIEDVDDLLEEE